MLATILQFAAGHAIAALMLSVGLQTDRAVFRDLATRWRLLARALAVVWIGVPVLTILVVAALRPGPIGAATLLVMAICPGVPIVVRSVRKAHGDLDTTLLVLISTAITAVVMVPLWAAVLARVTPFELAIDPWSVAMVLIPNVLVPFVLGRIVNRLAPRIAERLARVFSIVFFVGIVILLVVVLFRGIPVLGHLTLRALAAVLIVTLSAAAIGYLAGAPRRIDRTSVAFAAALGNPALALAVAAYSFPSADVLPLISAYVLLRGAAMIPFEIWLKHGRAGGTSTPLPRDPGFPHDRDLAHASGS